MAETRSDEDLSARLKRYAFITVGAAALVSTLTVWFGGPELLPTVLRNLPFGLLLSALITGAAAVITNLAIRATQGWPGAARWAVYLTGFVVAALIGAFLTPLIFHLGGVFPRRAVWINFEQNIRSVIPITLGVGTLVMLSHNWHARLRTVEEKVKASQAPATPVRLPSRLGGKVEFVDCGQVSHIYAQDKLTFAVAPARTYPLDLTMRELEARLPADGWLRLHRKTLVNKAAVKALRTDGLGRLFVRLADDTELPVARSRTAQVRAGLL